MSILTYTGIKKELDKYPAGVYIFSINNTHGGYNGKKTGEEIIR